MDISRKIYFNLILFIKKYLLVYQPSLIIRFTLIYSILMTPAAQFLSNDLKSNRRSLKRKEDAVNSLSLSVQRRIDIALHLKRK